MRAKEMLKKVDIDLDFMQNGDKGKTDKDAFSVM